MTVTDEPWPLAWPWPSSGDTEQVIPAFVAALQSVQDVARNQRAEIEMKAGGKLRYGFADLDAVLDAIKPELTAKGLAVTQPPTADGVHAILMHSSGQWLAFPPLHVSTGQNTPQGQGSALTYARRYQMLAMFNIATQDDDGHAAKPPRKTTGSAAQRPANVTPDGEIQPRTPSASNALDKPTPAQIRMAGALFNGQGWTEAERHARTTQLVGREVASWNDLTRAEFTAMIDQLKGLAPA